MKKFLSVICASAIALTGVVSTGVSASAAPAMARSVDAGPAGSNLHEIQYRGDGRWDRRGPDRRWDRRDDRRWDRRAERRGFYRDGGYHYYNGHRGYRERRAGYRQHQGYWFPAAAFIAGAIAGGAIAQPVPPPRRVVVQPGRLSQAHVNWCYDRYRSYRASDNSFQPYNGPRRVCTSPYG